MSFQPPSLGVAAALGMNGNTSLTTGAAVAEAYEFLNCQLAVDQPVIVTEGMRGTRMHPQERTRSGLITPSGTLTLQPSHSDLSNLMPRIVSPVTGNNYTVADSNLPPYFQAVVDYVAKVFTFIGCKTARARFHGSAGQNLGLDLDIEAITYSIGNSGTFGNTTVAASAPYVFYDGTLTINNTTYQVIDWETIIDWHLLTDRFLNSQTRSDLPSTDLTVSTRMTLPWNSDTVSLYNGNGSVAGSVAGQSANIVFAYSGTNGGNCTFTYQNLIFPANKSPTVGAKTEIGLALSAQSRSVAGAAPLVVTIN